ncbi:MAG: S-methyl-5-thioribose kinase [Firmicutes bacterium]|nr:S-methyl-5-thioribose kinase [Bacillota bacterium]
MALYRPFQLEDAKAYVRQSSLFAPDEPLEAQDLADGNVNYVYRVYNPARPDDRSVIVKQALPYARIVGESFPMPLDRARIESRALEVEKTYCPDLVPRVYRYDPEMALTLMEDLRPRIIMRAGLIHQVRYPRFAQDLGRFMARTLFFTSDLSLDSDAKKRQVVEFTNPGLCKVTEDLVFTHPLVDHPGNRWNPLIEGDVRRLQKDELLRAEVADLKMAFMTRAEALLHADLHTGSIMISEQDTKVIDPEFAFVGPMSFDIGTLLGNLALAWIAQEFHADDPERRRSYRQWIEGAMREVWETFSREFTALWEERAHPEWPRRPYRDTFLARLLQESAGMGGAELIRRVVGLAHVMDLESIPDGERRAVAERMAISAGRTWIMERRGVHSVDDLVALVRTARDTVLAA